jgi:hypothetical protein
MRHFVITKGKNYEGRLWGTPEGEEHIDWIEVGCGPDVSGQIYENGIWVDGPVLRRRMIIDALEEIDRKTIRALRSGSNDYVVALESEAQILRTQLSQIEGDQ